MSVDACVFCRILAGELPSTTVAEEDRAVAFMDVNPATPGHLLVVPRTHAPDLFTVDPADLAACATLAQKMARRVRERLGADGVNLIQSSGAAAWQTVFHLHVHVIPRYDGDPLILPWQPAPGNAAEIAAVATKLTGD
ncbi:HIT family protein [Actinopolymorpha alba]|uniref:HIT family protein n=1 Tax=Actinopolymorpha alba TaxID=533267 RepID=UPI00036B96D9|nr:HIT family protein [Actinopolymorpha alba]